MARGQPWRGGSLLGLPGRLAGGFPGILWGCFGTPKPPGIPRAGRFCPAGAPGASPALVPKTRPRERAKLWDGEKREHPHGPRASPSCPREPSWHRGWPLWPHGVGAIPAQGPRAPPAPPPPGCGKLSKRADGAGERRQEEEESRKGYFLTLHILQVEHFVHFSPACKSISASAPGLDGGACESTAAGDDVAAGGGQAGRRGPPSTGAVWGVPLTYGPAAPSQSTIPAAVTSASSHRGGTGGWAHTHPTAPQLPYTPGN